MKAGADPLLPWTYCWIRINLLVSVKLNLLDLLEILPDKMDGAYASYLLRHTNVTVRSIVFDTLRYNGM